jgi:hypothetical protein
VTGVVADHHLQIPDPARPVHRRVVRNIHTNANTMELLIFKTNASPQHLDSINQCLGAIPGIAAWDFDLDDTDKILRVKTDILEPRAIEKHLHIAGYECAELPD